MDKEKLVSEAREVLVEILQDCLEENKKTMKTMQYTIILLVLLLAGSFAYYLYSFYSFIEQYDYENTKVESFIETQAENDASLDNINNFSVEKNK